jgi:hypothetical protein
MLRVDGFSKPCSMWNHCKDEKRFIAIRLEATNEPRRHAHILVLIQHKKSSKIAEIMEPAAVHLHLGLDTA